MIRAYLWSGPSTPSVLSLEQVETDPPAAYTVQFMALVTCSPIELIAEIPKRIRQTRIDASSTNAPLELVLIEFLILIFIFGEILLFRPDGYRETERFEI